MSPTIIRLTLTGSKGGSVGASVSGSALLSNMAGVLSDMVASVLCDRLHPDIKKISVSKIFEIIDTKKRIDENKIVKATKKAHVGKIKSFLIDAVKIINPIHWFKKLVVNSTISFATRKISLIIIDIVADESNKTYSKKIFDKEKSIREMEIEQILEELEKEEQDA